MASPNSIIQLSSTGYSKVFPVNFEGPNPYIGMQLVITGTGTYTVQITQYDPGWENYNAYPDIYTNLGLTGNFANDAVWGNHDTLVNLTATSFGSLTVPIRALRLYCSSYASGTATLIITQPSHR